MSEHRQEEKKKKINPKARFGVNVVQGEKEEEEEEEGAVADRRHLFPEEVGTLWLEPSLFPVLRNLLLRALLVWRQLALISTVSPKELE